MRKLVVFSLCIISLWWIFQVVWLSGFVHVLAQSNSVAIDRAVSYATAGTTQYDDIFFTHAEIAHLVDVSHLYKVVSISLNVLSIGSWLVLLWAVYSKQNLQESLRTAAKCLVGIAGAGLLASAFFSFFFEWFHLLLFPQGNWAFPADSMLITLFPESFWRAQLLCIMGLLCAFAGLYWSISQLLRK